MTDPERIDYARREVEDIRRALLDAAAFAVGVGIWRDYRRRSRGLSRAMRWVRKPALPADQATVLTSGRPAGLLVRRPRSTADPRSWYVTTTERPSGPPARGGGAGVGGGGGCCILGFGGGGGGGGT
uniref:hypothetical protein n=1 Tax=Nocardia farcinica TaxID=37329 RepID=UPI002456E6A9